VADAAEDGLTAGMVRVVAQNGTVWWVNPASAAFYMALTQDAARFVVDDGFKLYWQNQKAKPVCLERIEAGIRQVLTDP
jgi:hypothetical protein